ncbi:MAG TPA: hypothetical protein VKX28_32075 [Xanthobacteraceae bacterium]|nr:hypothetical protein [Xanthobacteraceae bacterium]
MTASTDSFNGVEETLAKLAHQAAIHTPDPRLCGPQADMRVDARISPSSAAAMLDPPTVAPAMPDPAMLGPADLGAQIAREPQQRRNRSTLVRVAIAICVGAAAVWALRSYGGPAREMVATLAPASSLTSARPTANQPPVPTPAPTPDPAPTQAAAPPAAAPVAAEAPPPPVPTTAVAPPAPPAANEPAAASADHQQIDAMARDVAALRQTVEQLAAGQEQLKGEIAKLEAEKAAAEKPPIEKPKKRAVHHVSDHLPDHAPGAIRYSDAFDPAQNPNAPGAPRTIGSVVVHRATPPTSGVTTLGPLPPPQAPGVPRPPMPVQQP